MIVTLIGNNNLYKLDLQEDSEGDFNKAWKHHYMVNDHHPEYWKNTNNGEI